MPFLKHLALNTDYPYEEEQQYIGVNDKNDKEIYERDIVEYIHKHLDHPVRFEVIFYGEGFCQNRWGVPQPDIWYDWEDVKIIGNADENPELLEEIYS